MIPPFKTLELVPVGALLNPGYRFYVPAYQRGYRWSADQALQLVDDILDFEQHYYSKDKSKFYCLQPLVVKLREEGPSSPIMEHREEGASRPLMDHHDELEVIDGQQRLTTIMLLLQAIQTLKCEQLNIDRADVKKHPRLYSIKYETREESDKWLTRLYEALDSDKGDTDFECANCDFFHIGEVFRACYNRLSALDEVELGDFTKALLKGTRFIWYNPREASGTNAEIFDRLNDGKIGLNDAELIKALFLQRANWMEAKPGDDDAIDRWLLDPPEAKALALEWNDIENALGDKEFWGFIKPSGHPFQYDTRIEYLFDLIKKKTEKDKDTRSFTFNKYLDSYREMRRGEGDSVAERSRWVKEQWREVKELYDTLREWYRDKKLYHRIGFILECVAGESGITLRDKLRLLSRDKRIETLDRIIRDRMKGIKSDKLFHNNNKNPELSVTLYLYNILLEDRRVADNARFSFADYKNVNKEKGWDQEHIASHIDYDPSKAKESAKRAVELAKDLIELLTGEMPSGEAAGEYAIRDGLLNEIETEERELCELALSILNSDDPIAMTVDDEKGEKVSAIENLYNRTTEQMGCDEDEFKSKTVIASNGSEKTIYEKDFIWNFALLNSKTNRSYGNNIYPVKRRRILADEFEVYTPVGTRNVFEKAYSRRVDQMISWTRSDALAYWRDICRQLEKYIDPNNFTLPFNA